MKKMWKENTIHKSSSYMDKHEKLYKHINQKRQVK